MLMTIHAAGRISCLIIGTIITYEPRQRVIFNVSHIRFRERTVFFFKFGFELTNISILNDRTVPPTLNLDFSVEANKIVSQVSCFLQ